jgi:integrase
MKARGLKAGSITSAMLHVRRFFPDTSLRLKSMSHARVKALYQSLVDEGLAQGTHRTYLLAARTLFAWCVSEGMLPSNPATAVKVLGRRKYGKAQHRVDELRLWEAEAFRMATSGDQQALAALVALYLGMRATEITLRVVRDVDDGGRILWIPDAKTESGRRALDVPAVIVPMLASLVAGRPREDVLFPGERKPRRHRDWVREGVHRICDVAKVPRVSAHAMRGALATIAAERGQLGHMAAAHFGHTTPVMTEQAYAKAGSKDTGTRARGMQVLQGGKR